MCILYKKLGQNDQAYALQFINQKINIDKDYKKPIQVQKSDLDQVKIYSWTFKTKEKIFILHPQKSKPLHIFSYDIEDKGLVYQLPIHVMKKDELVEKSQFESVFLKDTKKLKVSPAKIIYLPNISYTNKKTYKIMAVSNIIGFKIEQKYMFANDAQNTEFKGVRLKNMKVYFGLGLEGLCLFLEKSTEESAASQWKINNCWYYCGDIEANPFYSK